MAESLLQILTGMALLFLAQARIQRSVEDQVFSRLRSSVIRLVGSSGPLWLIGLLSSLLLQASRIPFRVATKLVERRLVSAEQAYILNLGVALGCSIKGWFFAAQLQIQVALAFLFAGMVLSLFRKMRLAILGIPLIAAGCFWASLELTWQGFYPFLNDLARYQSHAWLSGTHLLSQLWLMLLGVVLVVFLRTSTLPLFIVLQLCWASALRFEAGAALILGINIGMGLAPFERRSAKTAVAQLTWAHLFNRAGFGLLVLFFLPNFLQLASLLVPGPGTPSYMAFRLSFFHILLNALMATGGLFSMGLVFRIAHWITPGEQGQHAILLSHTVRRMLQKSPDYALREVENQLQIALEHTKQLTDQELRLLIEKIPRNSENGQEGYLFETIQHSVYDLLLPLYHKDHPELRPKIQSELRVLDCCGQLYSLAHELKSELEEGLQIQRFMLPDELLPMLEQYQGEFNELWLAVLLRRPYYRGVEALETSLERLEEGFYEDRSASQSFTGDQLIWQYRILSLLRQQSILLYQVYQSQHES